MVDQRQLNILGIMLSNGETIDIGDDDFEQGMVMEIIHWYFHGRGYLIRLSNGEGIFVHNTMVKSIRFKDMFAPVEIESNTEEEGD